MNYYCSDLHLHHKYIANNLGFETTDEYHEALIKNWNTKISKRDVVYILGDITFETKKYEILGKLNGIKKVVLGNHDLGKPSYTAELQKYVQSIHGSIRKTIGEFDVYFTHIPIHPMELEYGINFNVHGHIHEKLINDYRYINMCLEQIGLTPVEETKLYNRMKALYKTFEKQE